MRCEEFLSLMASASSGIQLAYRQVLADWRPEDPPVTTLYAALGEQIAEHFDGVDIDTNRKIFVLIEEAMENGDQELVTAVATGLIEALVTRAVRSESLWKRIALLIGPRTLHHAEAWLAA